MATDVKDAGSAIGSALGTIAREVSHSVSSNGHKKMPFALGNGHGPLSGIRGLAAGAAVATAAPLAGKAVKRVVNGARGTVEEGAKDVKGKVEDAADPKSIAKKAGKKMLPGGGSESDDNDQQGAPGVGKGRRMPIEQAVDVGVPIRTAYNQWTQFEEWPQFMHRLDQATQEDDCTVSFKTKIWGMSKEFVGQIDEQRPDERIKWSVSQGVSHTGVVTFHELAPNLTRVQVTLDVEPGSLIEKAARGMRHVKRAVRADLSRFKAFIELQEEETGAWRGTIRDGSVVKKTSTSSRPKQKRRTPKKSRTQKKSRGSSSRPKSRSRSKSSSSRSKSGRSGGSTKRKSGSRS